ncbi:ABC transporter substrate-binding protein [Testudinibacter sp. P27/CKL/0425]
MKKFLMLLLLLSSVAHADTLTIGKRIAPSSWDPIDSYNLFWGAIASNLFDGLVLRTETFELKPGLATSWQPLDNGRRFRFQLRQNVRFHNGEPFNAHAVQFTFERLLDPKNQQNTLQRALYDSIERVEVIDDYAVDLVLKRYDPSLLVKLSGYGGMIVPPEYIKKHGETHFDRNPVGTGPFKFVKQQADSLQLDAYPDYFAGRAKLDSLVFRFIDDDEQRVREFLEGRLDVLHDLPFAAVPRIKKAAGKDLVSVPGLTVQTLQFNLDKKIVQDVRVRQALNMAIDKQVLINMLLNGYGRRVAGLQTEMTFGYDPQLMIYTYNPEKAKALLQQAGVQAGEKISINYRANNHNMYEIARAIGVFFKALDLTPEIKPIDGKNLRDGFLSYDKINELFQFGWNGWTMDFGDTAYLLFHSGQSWNPQIDVAPLDAMLEKQRILDDPQPRQHLLQQIARFIHEQAYYIPLFNEDSIYAISDSVSNFVPAPDRRMRYLNTEIHD